jgi:uncharacterized protein YndB with AHSA1/START domain
MPETKPLPPVRRSVVVPLDPSSAFDLFVRRIKDWWPLSARSIALENAVSCHIEPHVGGRVFERTRDGREGIWGRVVAWEEPLRLVFTWHPGSLEETPEEVEVRFVDIGGRTRVDLEHRNWEHAGEKAALRRGLFEGGWPGVLARFEALATGANDLPSVTAPGCISTLKPSPTNQEEPKQ